jgi:hypothetical protein
LCHEVKAVAEGSANAETNSQIESSVFQALRADLGQDAAPYEFDQRLAECEFPH